jgi:uncharacterized membrane protein
MTMLATTRSLGLALPRLGDVAAFLMGTFMLAGAIHISAILIVPYFAESDGWSRLAPLASTDRFAQITAAGTGPAGVGGLDPLFVNAACRLQIGKEPASLMVDARDRFWSLALYDPRGTIIFSLNDRTAVGGRLDMVVVTPAQNALLQAAPTAELDQTIIVESASDDLVALLRLFASTESAKQEARSVLEQAECLPAPSILPSG